jgi:hypothetical protein
LQLAALEWRLSQVAADRRAEQAQVVLRACARWPDDDGKRGAATASREQKSKPCRED